MSHQASSWAFAQQHPDLAPGAKFLLVAIANHADKAGVSWPGHQTLSEDCSCRIETVTQNMKRLEQLGLVRRLQRRRKNGSRTSDWIVLAPGDPDRRPMIDAVPDEYPPEVSSVAVSYTGEHSPEESSGDLTPPEDDPGAHLRKRGGPEPSEEPSPNDEEEEKVGLEPSSLNAETAHSYQRRAPVDEVAALLPAANRAALERAIAAFPDREHVAVAERCAHWIRNQASKPEQLDQAAAYHSFLKGAPRPRAGQASGPDWTPWVREHMPELVDATLVAVAAGHASRLGVDDPDPELVRRRMANWLEPVEV